MGHAKSRRRCQWCFVGKRQLEQAISLYQKTYPGGKNDQFIITWRPFYLNYNQSPHSVDKSELAQTKLAGLDQGQRARLARRMEQAGQSAGISFRWGGKIGSTHDAHRLVQLGRSKPPGVQNELVEGLFRAYHELEQDISDHDVLLDIALCAGLDRAEAEGLLGSAVLGNEVNAEAEAQRSRIGGLGVPFFVIQGDHRLSGAQDAMDFVQVFTAIKQAEGEDEVT